MRSMLWVLKPILVVIGLLIGLVHLTPVASADILANPACPATFKIDYVYWAWAPTSSDTANGIRAPIWSRHDGLLCTPASDGPSLGNWIGIGQKNGAANAIVQIGYLHEYIAGVSEWCRFYEDPGIDPQTYDCTQSDDEWVYFRIQVVHESFGDVYEISDCGTEGDFNSCTTEDSYGPLFSSPQADVASEAHWACAVYMMGQTSNPVTYGNSAWHVTVDNNSGWSRVAWGSFAPSCTNGYSGGGYSDGLETWDTRNTS